MAAAANTAETLSQWLNCVSSLSSLYPGFEYSLQQWQRQQAFKQKLQAVLLAVLKQFNARDICVLQVWFNCSDRSVVATKLQAETGVGVVCNQLFADFQESSCQTPIELRLGMPGRVWRTGSVQVVQNLKIIPSCVHPRTLLKERHMEEIAEAVYLPVFDTQQPHLGPLAVIEGLLSTKATDPMLVASLISFLGSCLGLHQLSLSNPIPQPVRRSSLAGRRARAAEPADDVTASEKGDQAESTEADGGSENGEPASKIRRTMSLMRCKSNAKLVAAGS